MSVLLALGSLQQGLSGCATRRDGSDVSAHSYEERSNDLASEAYTLITPQPPAGALQSWSGPTPDDEAKAFLYMLDALRMAILATTKDSD